MIGRLLCWLGWHAPKLHRWRGLAWFVDCDRPGCNWTKEVRR